MAATSTVYIAVSLHGPNAASAAQRYVNKASDDKNAGINDLINLLAAVASGTENGRVYAAADDASAGTAATCTIACTQANATVGETVTVLGVVLTVAAAASSNPRDGHVVAGASDTTFGDSVAAVINAHPLLNRIVTAVNSTGTVTCTFKDKGLFANLGVLSETGDAFVVGQPSIGAEGTLSAALRAFAVGV